MVRLASYLNMKMKRTRREKNVATLSIVFSMITSWRRRAGMKRMSLRMRSRRNVRRTEIDWPVVSVRIPLRSSGFVQNNS